LLDSVNPLPERLERVAREIAEELGSRIDELAEQWYQRMVALPELAHWALPELRETGLENARSDIGREIAGLIAGRSLPESSPGEVIESARLAESSGFPLWASVQAYRTGHAVQWQAWSDAVEARGFARGARLALLRAGSEYMFAYADRCARWVEAEYTRERDRRLRGQEQLRIQLVRDLLEGKTADASQLGYELEGWHVAIIAAGAGAEAVMRDLSVGLDARLLSLAADRGTTWAWLRPNQLRLAAVERRLRSLVAPAGVSVAVGDPGQGPSGFRQSHLQARYAAAIAQRQGQSTAHYGDVALEALATADPEQATWFVSRELGPLAADDRRASTLRTTVTAYFAAGQRASLAAAALGVHERTIGNRLRATENLIGRSVLGRRAELETALRIRALLEDREPPKT
jgi:hypothetical protein